MRTQANKRKQNRPLPPALRHTLPSATQDLIKRIREKPARVLTGKHCVQGSYPSKKMGCTIGFESHRVEYPTILKLEYDPTVLEYYCQPFPIKLAYEDKNGANRAVLHTPDYFVVTATDAGYWETKCEKDIRALAEQMPNRYVRQPDGSWRCPPGERAAAAQGLTYRVFVTDCVSPEYTRNIIYIDDYRRREYPAPSTALIGDIQEAVRNNQGVTAKELIESVRGASIDHVLYLIYRGEIYTDLSEVVLAEPETVFIYTDSLAAQAHKAAKESARTPISKGAEPLEIVPTAKILWKGEEHTIIEADPNVVELLSKEGKRTVLRRTDLELAVFAGKAAGISPAHAREQAVLNIIAGAGKAKLAEALRRWHIIQPLLANPKLISALPKKIRRSVKRWLRAHRVARAATGNGFVGLIPKDRPGYEGSHLDPVTEELVQKIIVEKLEVSNAPSVQTVYNLLLNECASHGVPSPSLKTFRDRVRARPQYEQERSRKSRKAAARRKKFVFFLDQTTPVHGERAWEIGHIDHTQLDIEVVCSRTGVNLGRPWLTLLIDARTRRILAIYVSMFGESYESAMMVLRECVRRHSRLPQILVVDNGRSFNNVYFDTLLANFGVTRKSRPASQPRFGSVCERIFGTINSQFIHALCGNTKLTKNVREITEDRDPKKLARWTLENLVSRAQTYCYEVYDTAPHVSLGRSPRDEMAALLDGSGSRDHTLIPFSPTFQILTLPTTESGVAKVHPTKGIRVNYLDYWCEAFRDPKVEGEHVEVRFDPWDASVAYAFVHGKWQRCYSSRAAEFKHWSQRAIAIASNALRARFRTHGQNKSITALRLAQFMKEVQADEEMMLLRAREAATRGERSLVDDGGKKPTPVPPSQSPQRDGSPEQPITEPQPEDTTTEYEVVNQD